MDSKKSSATSLSGHVEKSVDSLPIPALLAEENLSRQKLNPSIEQLESENGASQIKEEYPTGKLLIPILLAIIGTVFVVALDMTIVGTAIPKITDEFKGLNDVSWYGSAYFMTFGGFQSASGKFYRYFPLKPSFLAFLAVFEVGSLICAVSKDNTTFIIGRAIAGMGGAAIMTGSFTIVAFATEPKRRPALMGLVGAVYGLASVVGPVLGGIFSDKITWRWCFYINLPVGGLCALLIFIFFKTPPQAVTTKATWKEKVLQMDPFGIALVMTGIITFILAVQYGGQTKPWNSATVVALFMGCGFIWIVFFAWEVYNGERSMLPPRLLRQRTIWQPSCFQFFFSAGYLTSLYYLPIYFQSVDNKTAIESGVLNMPLVIALAFGAMLSGIVVTKTGHAAPFQVFGAILGTIAAGLIYTYDIDTGLGKWIGYQVIYGAAIGLAFQMAMNIAQANAKMEDMSSVTATVFFAQTIGGAFSVAAAQSCFANRLLTTLAKTAPGINPLMVVGTGATEIRHVFPVSDIPGIVLAYMAGIKITFALIVALTGTSCIFAVFVPWRRLNVDMIQGGV